MTLHDIAPRLARARDEHLRLERRTRRKFNRLVDLVAHREYVYYFGPHRGEQRKDRAFKRATARYGLERLMDYAEREGIRL